MKCDICGNGELMEGTTTMMLQKDETIIVFRDVPAFVCDQCGEAYTDSSVTARLHQIVREEAARGLREGFIQYSAA
jgi:YgiT-type zinc finger domain-containing protein